MVRERRELAPWEGVNR